MGRGRALLAAICCLAFGVTAPVALGQPTFRARIGHALGLIPPFGNKAKLPRADVATGAQTPEGYHGGPVMAGGVTVHTIFWAPAGYSFQGSPGQGVPTYKGLIQQFFTDLAHDSGAGGSCTNAGCNAFSVLPQFAEGLKLGQITPGAYSISYNAASDSIDASDPYPAKSSQCASPAGTATCVTDGQIQAEIDHIVQGTSGTPRGLNNLWFVFLPPAVDECIAPGSCGTNSFAGYHAVSNVNGHGITIYAISIDPIIEAPVGAGADPNGFPDGEAALDIAGHETVEAMTDPEGSGWMDPSGLEVGDKCEVGPQTGTPLGFAANGSPYNQVINGHQYLLQQMWANLDSGGNPGCVQSTTTATNQLPLPQVNLRQFNPVITGNVNRASGGGIGVTVTLVREGPNGKRSTVARASTTTAADGSWSVSLAPHAVGDDRDEIDIDYSGPGAPQPGHQVILTGNGGNPFTEAGWTGWLAMDEGSAVRSGGGGSSLTLAPCFQTGTLSFTFDGFPGVESPTDFCNTQTDAATEGTAPIRPGDTLTATSNDNRAFSALSGPTPNPLGGLVSLTVRVGEANAFSRFTSPLAPLFTPTGLPLCIADLEAQAVGCIGVVPNQSYTLTDGRQRVPGIADSTGEVVAPMFLRGGDAVTLSNGSRKLTTLHVAHLRVAIAGDETVLAGGRCQPGDYYGAPPTAPPVTTEAGLPTSAATGGYALTGVSCPTNGHAAGLPTSLIAQTDDQSGGLTETEVPDIQDTSPIQGETVYGRFTALAETGLPGPSNSLIPTDFFSAVSVKIVPASGAPAVFGADNVDTPDGVSVPALTPGKYLALWTLIDVNGDIRFAATRFIEAPGRVEPGPRTNVTCKYVGSAHSQLGCKVTFPGEQPRGKLRIRVTRGGLVVAIGQGVVRKGRARITMAVIQQPTSGRWHAVMVLSGSHIVPVTIQAGLKNVT